MLPKDPIMLMSVLNTQLRDHYDSLDAFCEDKDEDKEMILNVLNNAGYEYNEALNKFMVKKC